MRSALFFLVMACLGGLSLWLLVPIASEDNPQIIENLSILLASAPHVLKDLGVLGEATPAALAAGMIALAPRKSDPLAFWGGVFAATAIYVVFLYFTVFFEQTAPNLISRTQELESQRGEIFSLFEGVRLFSGTIIAAMLGIALGTPSERRIEQPAKPVVPAIEPTPRVD